MKTFDLFGVLARSLGQVKNCPLFQGSVPPVDSVVPPVNSAEPPISSTSTIGPDPIALWKGVSLTADVQNEQGETARGIELAPGLDPVYLMATAVGILNGAPASAFDPEQAKQINLPMMMTDKSPGIIRSTSAAVRPGYSKKVWFFKIDRSPVTFEILPEEMKDVDGTPLAGVAFVFPQVGSFYMTPAAVVLRDGDDLDMKFTVKIAPVLGTRYPVRNL